MSKLDYLKKYLGGNGQTSNSGKEYLKKRLDKQTQKKSQTMKVHDEDKLLWPQKQNQQSNKLNPLIQEEDQDFSDDDQPIIVNNNMNLSDNMRKRLLDKGEIKLPKGNAGKWVSFDSDKEETNKKRKRSKSSSSESSQSSESEDEKVKKSRKRKRHDSDVSDDEEVQPETQKRLKVDQDGDIDLSAQEEEEQLIEKSGLQTASEIKEFTKKAQEKANKQLMEQLMREGSTNQATIYRNKEGQIVQLKDKLLTEKDRLRIANEELLKKWKGGVKQAEEAKERRQQLEEAKNEPFARHEIAPEADLELKQKERFGDPMKLIKSSTMRSQQTQQMYKVYTTANGYRYLLPRCKFPGTVNRFGIEPGHKWDGVDRSNGYERRWIDKENESKDNQNFFHKWATEEM